MNLNKLREWQKEWAEQEKRGKEGNRRVNMIKNITSKEAFGIIIARKPLGKFFKIDNVTGKYLGVDNTTGDAWVEEFEDIEECICWLNQEK